MNSYNESLQKAQDWADQVLFFKKNAFLDQVCAAALRVDGNAYLPEFPHWFRISGFRWKADPERTGKAVNQAASQWLRASGAAGSPCAFVLEREASRVSVLYGGGESGSGLAFLTSLPECRIEPCRWTPQPYRYTGIALGTAAAQDLADTVAGAAGLLRGFVACLAVPVADSEILTLQQENRRGIAWLGEHKSFQKVYGNATRRVEEVPVESVVQAIGVLKEENAYLERERGAGFVRTALRFGADTLDEYEQLASWIRSCAVWERDQTEGWEPVRCYPVENGGSACLAVPGIPVEMGGVYRVVHPLTFQDIPSAASFCQPPLRSWEGCYVKNDHIDENAAEVFPVTAPVEEGIAVGQICNSRFAAAIPLEGLLCHSAVFGASGTGKTTTVMRILTEAYQKQGIPFVVLEAAKKEYAALIGEIPELRVYTPGTDGLPLQWNPLQPEDGTLIENHAAAVVRALMAATGGEHPIPEAYEGLLREVYRKSGWEYGQMAYTDPAKPFPTFRDVLDQVDGYIAGHAPYGPEVRQNLTAALKLRSETMYAGALGRLFHCSSGLTARELLEAPTVIELSDFSEQSVTFLMSLLLYRFQCYAAQLPPEHTLKRLIVVEEAHNVFQKTRLEDSGRGQNNRAVEKMLAEIRSSGTGMILSDQRPSIMPEALLANTAVKMVHAMESEEDREAVGGPMDLTPYQRRKIREFQPGECAVSLRGKSGVQHVQVTPASPGKPYTAACLSCTGRFRCRRAAVVEILERMDPEKLAFHLARIHENPYNTGQVAKRIDQMLQDLQVTAYGTTRCCLLGEMLKRAGQISFQESRILVQAYAAEMRRKSV